MGCQTLLLVHKLESQHVVSENCDVTINIAKLSPSVLICGAPLEALLHRSSVVKLVEVSFVGLVEPDRIVVRIKILLIAWLRLSISGLLGVSVEALSLIHI